MNVKIKTYGCSLNQSDSEAMAGLLQEEGHQIVDDDKDADVIVINSCTVKGPTETKIFKEINRLKKENKKIEVIVWASDTKWYVKKIMRYIYEIS